MPKTLDLGSKNLLVGADVGGTNVKYVVLDAAGRRQVQDSIPTDPSDPAGTIARLAEAAGHSAAENKRKTLMDADIAAARSRVG